MSIPVKMIFGLLPLFIATGSSAQLIYEEHFDSDPSLLIIDNDGYVNQNNSTETWSWSNCFRHFGNGIVTSGNYAMRSITDPFPAVNGQQSDDWIILPQLSIPPNALLVFEFCAESRVDGWSGYPELEVKISTTDSLLGSFITIKTITVNHSYFRLEKVDLSAYAGQNAYIAIVNRCYNPPGWGWKKIFVDDIQVGVFNDYDLQGFTFLPSGFGKVGDTLSIGCSFVNRGLQTINSMDVHYRVNGGQVQTGSLTGLNMAQHDTLHTAHPVAWVPSSTGTYTVELWADNLNGNTDGNHSNDTLTRQYEVYTKVTKKRPLMEVFSGADCSACAALAGDFDRFVEAWQFNAAAAIFSSIEYETYYNDPSDNADATTRDTYYGVTGYPDEQISDIYDYRTLFFDRSLFSFYPFFDPTLSIASAYPAFIEMGIDATINGNTLDVTVNVLPLKDFTGNAVLHIAVCEKEYTYTGGQTSQTVFKHVMRKMLPDGNGTLLGTLTDGVPVSASESYSFTVGNVTEGSYNLWVGMNNIEIVAFVQNLVTRDVYQSAALRADDINGLSDQHVNKHTLLLYPSPVSDALYINTTDNQPVETIRIHSVSGVCAMEKTYNKSSEKSVLDVRQLSAGLYILSAFDAYGGLIGRAKFAVSR
ncbi:MAG: choice-of-anchor J domain-containing protein [Flavobacteriales bacterium]